MLVPIGRERTSRGALRHAGFLASLAGADVVLLHFATEGLPVKPSLYAAIPEDAPALATARRDLEQAAGALRDQDLTGEILQLVAGPGMQALADAVLAEARPRHCDLIVAAAHNRTAFHRLLFGSTIDALEHQVTDIPLLIVPDGTPA